MKNISIIMISIHIFFSFLFLPSSCIFVVLFTLNEQILKIHQICPNNQTKVLFETTSESNMKLYHPTFKQMFVTFMMNTEH